MLQGKGTESESNAVRSSKECKVVSKVNYLQDFQLSKCKYSLEKDKPNLNPQNLDRLYYLKD